MPRRTQDDDDLDANEFPEPDSDDDGSETIACPYCGKQVYEDAGRCPYCENYLSGEDAPLRVPAWLAVGALLALAAALTWVFM
jgi:uncharacterized paraquat-inducible protein A